MPIPWDAIRSPDPAHPLPVRPGTGSPSMLARRDRLARAGPEELPSMRKEALPVVLLVWLATNPVRGAG
jgi:hypothetical protein